MEDMPERSTATAAKLEVSPVDSALANNGELIATIEKQVEVLSQRLSPVSATVPSNDSTKDTAGVRGSSTLVETIGSQGYKLSNISDRLSTMTRNLEI